MQRWTEQLHISSHEDTPTTTQCEAESHSPVDGQQMRKRPRHDVRPGVPAPSAMARQLSSSSLSTCERLSVCRLSLIAYFEVTIERDDSEDTTRREREAQEAADKRRRERERQRLAGETGEASEEEDEGEQRRRRHRFADRPQCVSIGLATLDFPLLSKQPGWDRHSYGYHGDDGAMFHGTGVGSRPFGPSFGAGDVVGCGLDYRDGSILFTRNGAMVGVVPIDPPGLVGEWYGVVGLDSRQVVRVSTTGPFAFDVGKWEMESERQKAHPTLEVVARMDLKRVWREQRRKKKEKEGVELWRPSAAKVEEGKKEEGKKGEGGFSLQL